MVPQRLVALAAAAAVTERIGLSTSVLLGPLRENAASVAKQALSIHALSGGRMTLGIGLGGRDDDYEMVQQYGAAQGHAEDRHAQHDDPRSSSESDALLGEAASARKPKRAAKKRANKLLFLTETGNRSPSGGRILFAGSAR